MEQQKAEKDFADDVVKPVESVQPEQSHSWTELDEKKVLRKSVKSRLSLLFSSLTLPPGSISSSSRSSSWASSSSS